MIKKILIFLFLTTTFLYGQTNKTEPVKIKPTTACDFIFEADSTITGKDFKVVSYLIDGYCDLNESPPIRAKFAVILQSTVPISKVYFAKQLSDICMVEKCTLAKIGAYRMSTPGEVTLILTYTEKK